MSTTILLVDDEPDTFDLFRQRFRREIKADRIALHFVPSAHHALERLDTSNPPDVVVVLSDINMPGMTGWELLGEIKQRWPDLVVFMLTAYGDAGSRQRAADSGADEFFSKPVDFVALKQALDSRLDAGPAA